MGVVPVLVEAHRVAAYSLFDALTLRHESLDEERIPGTQYLFWKMGKIRVNLQTADYPDDQNRYCVPGIPQRCPFRPLLIRLGRGV